MNDIDLIPVESVIFATPDSTALSLCQFRLVINLFPLKLAVLCENNIRLSVTE